MNDRARLPALGVRRRPVARRWSLAPLGQPDAAQPVLMPCQWQTVQAFAQHAGPFVYAADFERPPWARVHLVAEGTFHTASWRLNGDLLGVHAGAWDEARYDITDRLVPGPNHLDAEVACPPEVHRLRHRATGVFGGWDCLPTAFQAGGMWRPVYLEAAGDVRIEVLWLTCEEVTEARARVVVHARLRASRSVACTAVVRLRPPSGRGRAALRAHLVLDVPAGRSQLDLPLAVDRPLVWEPWSRSGRAEADLYDLALVLRPAGPGAAARRSARVGIRTVARDHGGRFVLNGRPMFVKGWNYGPSDAHLAASTAERVNRDLAAMRERGLDGVRVHAHVDVPALYRAADRLGLIVFQDGPLQWAYASDAFPEAAVAVRAIAQELASHPSVVELRVHNEPLDVVPTTNEPGREPVGTRVKAVIQTFLWSENRDVWDRAVEVAVAGVEPARKANGAMLTYPHSGIFARRRGDDTHLYLGWYPQFGPMRGLDWLFRLVPGAGRWLSEFGAQSVPGRATARTFMPEHPVDVDWRYLSDRRMAQIDLLERYVGIAGLDLDTVIARTQAYQAALHGAYIDRLRAFRDRPTAGFFGFFWADCADGITWSLLDRERRPKAAFETLREQLQPLAVVALLPLVPPRPHGMARLPLYVVNDTAWAASVRVTARLGDRTCLERTLDVGPEAAARGGELIVPSARLLDAGTLELTWQAAARQGTGPPPMASGSRRYALPSPLWRRWPRAQDKAGADALTTSLSGP